MRRIALAVLLVSLLLPTALASADQQITASFNKKYDNPNVTMAQGERLTFRNNDFVRHDVTSEVAGQFSSALIDTNETAAVEGSQYLTTGTYRYVCSIHAEMTGVLTVSSEGTPVPRPGSGGPAPAPAPTDTTPPTLALRAPATKASAVRKSGKLKVLVSSDEAASMKLRASSGSALAGLLSAELVAAAGQPFTVRISSGVRRKLSRGSKLRLTVTARDAAGNPGSATLTVKLR